MNLELSLSEFKSAVDASQNAAEARESAKYEVISSQVRGCFAASDRHARDRAAKLRSEIILRHVVDGEATEPYLGFAEALNSILREGGTSTEDHNDWQRAVGLIAANSRSFSLLSGHDNNVLLMNPADVALGKTLLNLRELGYQISIAAGAEIDLPDETMRKLGADIDDAVRIVGGRELMSSVLYNLRRTFNEDAGRYMLVRPLTTTVNVPDPQVPWAYLYQLALKHFDAPSQQPGEASFNRLIKLATSAVALLRVQPYSGFKSMFLGSGSIMGFLRESVVYDSLFTLPQVPFRHLSVMTQTLIANSHFGESSVGGMPIKSVVQIAEGFVGAAKVDQPMVFTAAELGRRLNKSQANVAKVLDRIFCHEAGKVNASLTFVPKSTDIDSGFRPLLRLGSNQYWCPPQQIAGPAALEALQAALRPIHKNFDADLGALIEKLLTEQLSAKGIAVKSGDYDLGKLNGKQVQGECDLVVETASTIVLFELKKKPLTRVARAGSDVDLLIDMAKGLLDPQLQAMGHERYLRRNGSLTLTRKDGRQEEILLNGREVIRVAVVFMDFGSIQDRHTFQQFMRISCGVTFDAIDPKEQKKLDQLGGRLAELKEIATEWNELDKTFAFSTSYFLSIPQLLFILDAVDDADSFVDELLLGRRMITPTKDFFAEHLGMRQIRRAGAVKQARTGATSVS